MSSSFGLVCLMSLAVSAGDAGLMMGDVAPPLNIVPFDGSELGLAVEQVEGAVSAESAEAKPEPRATILVFFSTWDDGLADFNANLEQMHAYWSQHGVKVIAIARRQDRETINKQLGDSKPPWILAADTYGVVSRRYQVTKTPHTFVIASDNTVAYQDQGSSIILMRADRILSREMAQDPLGLVVTPPKEAEETTDAAQIRFARAPAVSDSAIRWQPLAAHISEQTNKSVKMVQESGYPAFKDGIRDGSYDLFNAGPMLCYQGREKYEPLVIIEREGNRSYTGITFVPRASRIKSLKDLRGKTIGLVSPNSTSGGLYPRKLLLDAGLRPSRDVRIKWLGSHEQVANAVKRRWVHAGGCFDDCRDLAWKNPSEKVRATRILEYTPKIPGEMIMVRRDIPDEIKEAIRQALLSAPQRQGLLSQLSKGEPPISDIANANQDDVDSVGSVVDQVESERRD
ncbi:MAG: phosphate/phosphite/phosphonate ABC transporter substrate-binding protein [Myxococcota bacterium]|nr:phosphate/phosphite/phosphonate ABC transporter substrate-binding protein [Myxococcota bacterium]